MSTVTCEACGNHVARWDAVQRGDARTVHYWHRDCFTVARALPQSQPVLAIA